VAYGRVCDREIVHSGSSLSLLELLRGTEHARDTEFHIKHLRLSGFTPEKLRLHAL